MDKNEEHAAAAVIGEMLTSAMLKAYEDPSGPRRHLYSWERDGLRWLLRYMDRNKSDFNVGNAWMNSFLYLNEGVITSEDGLIDFNLREFNECNKWPAIAGFSLSRWSFCTKYVHRRSTALCTPYVTITFAL